MRIRHVLPQLAMGCLPGDPLRSALTGVVNAAWSLAVQQAADGHDVEIVAPSENRQVRQCIAGVKIHRLAQWSRLCSPRYDFSFLFPLYLFTLRSRAVDVTHVHSNPFFLVRRRSRANVLHFHNSPVKSSHRYDRAVARAERVICCSHFIRQQFLEAVTYPPSQSHVVHNGVDRMLFGRPQRRGARAAYGILDERIVLLYVGRIRPEKGLLDLIEAVEKIVQRGEREPLLLVAGSGTLGYEAQRTAHPELQAYEQQVRHRAASLPVRFLGEVPRPDLPRLYRAADIFVCPSVYEEPFGMVNVEAAAAGLPVIATSVGGIPEAVLHEHNGLLVSAGDAQALADALLRLMSDSSLRYRLGRVAQDLASQHDWRVLTGKVAEIYDRALRQRSEKAGVIA